MQATAKHTTADICRVYGNDRHRLLDILRDIQARDRWISPDTLTEVAANLGVTRVAVEGVASFYAFLSLTPKGRITIRLCDDIVDRHAGLAAVQQAFEEELGISTGQTRTTGQCRWTSPLVLACAIRPPPP